MAKRPRDSVEREIMDIIPERFDADAGSMEARRGAHTRVILTIALALLALAAIGIVARLLFVGNGQQIAADATVPVIKADDKPIKTKPDDRGGMAVPNQDKLVYKDVGKTDTAQNEKLAPAPEKPQVPAAKAQANTPAASSDMPVPPPPAIAPADNTDSAPAQSQMANAAPAAANPPAAAPSAPMSAAKPAAMASAAPATPAKAGAAAATKPATANTTTASAAPAPAPSAAMAPAMKANAPAASAGGTWQVQLAAMKSEPEAAAAWKKALAGNKELLGNLTEETVQADLGAKGTFFRVRVGPLDEAAAKTLCAELTKRNQGCIVARK